ncbi:cytochrome b5-related protein-like isoform X2 [Daktulosphaira vitifoliae]|nr:cytochrome b5-related protein-like isoform X2 [Daktulosphaira vitifoliae]XP_050534038.1 cytochrome b5-related protein-like isoform X2 [Daktulosphaira vitifoliae]XP_050534049.1 cytochrome b5-related protein-like isoform X2 [Daktulosphaira vitifoliae]
MAPQSRNSSWKLLSNLKCTQKNILTADAWMKARQEEEGAENLWRVHDKLYDLNEWISKHPGGSQWFKLTKGTDITELFESHHINMDTVNKILNKFYVRDATTNRLSPFTFKPDGFYNVLKCRVAKKLSSKELKKSVLKSILTVDILMFMALVTCALAAKTNIYSLAILSGIILGVGTVASHNFTHLKDNWRMYYMQLGLISVREWRISHIFSHHIYTNTVKDLEITLLFPFLHWYPSTDKPFHIRWFPYCTPVVYPFITLGQLGRRTLNFKNDKADLIALIIPMILLISGHLAYIDVIIMWLLVILSTSSTFTFIGFSAAHHYPENFHDGDELSEEYVDWGLYQTDSCSERLEFDNIIVSLMTFGDHTLHHLFPALDHSLIPYLQDIYDETCKEFGIEIITKSYIEYIFGQFKQLVRLTPNKPIRSNVIVQ